MGERERFYEGASTGLVDYPAWLYRVFNVNAIVAGRAVTLRTYLPHRYETLKYIAHKEPFAVVLGGVFYASMQAAAIAIGSSPHKIHLMAGKISDG